MNHRFVPIVIFVAALSCSKRAQRADSDLTESKSPPAVQRPTHEDPGPMFERKTGAIAASELSPIDAKAVGYQTDGEHVIVAIGFGSQRFRVDPVDASMTVEAGDAYGVAFPWRAAPDDAGQAEEGMIVRIASPKLPERFGIRVATRSPNTRYGTLIEGGTVQSIRVSTATAKPSKSLRSQLWSSAADWFMVRRGAFARFAEARSRALETASTDRSRRGRQPRSELHRMMDLYTGWTSVEEALQADRGLFLRAQDTSQRSVDIAQVPRLQVPTHPWDSMIAETGVEPSFSPIASYVPADMSYLYFRDLRTFVRLIKDVTQWASPLAQLVEKRASSSHFLSRYEEQLVIERSGLAETLGHVAAKEVAIVTSDPFLREGTDVSFLFHVNNRAALVGALGAFQARAQARHPTMKRAVSKIGGLDVERTFTPDGTINQYRAEFGDVLVISNSAQAIARIHDAHRGAVPRLSEQGDFRYMRARYPWSKDDSDAGFVFFSDAFVARTVSPEVKILEARRMAARADLLAINHAALLRGWIDGVPTASIDDLVSTGFLSADERKHPDGAAVTYRRSTGASSSWGQVRRLTPIRDLAISKVTQAEADAYEQFRQTYQQYWRRYIDPIGAEIRVTDGRVAVDARMLPLVEATEYDDLAREVGSQKVVVDAPGPGVQWTIAIGKDARLRKELERIAQSSIGQATIGLSWLGEWAAIGFADRGALWDLGLRTGMIPTLTQQSRDGIPGLDVLPRVPLYAAVHVANGVGLAAVLSAIKVWINDTAPGLVTWGPGEPYREVPIIEVGEARPQESFVGGLTLSYATVKDVFVVSPDRATLLGQIDRYLDGESPTVPTGPPQERAPNDAQTFLQLDPQPDGWLTRVLQGLAEHVGVDTSDDLVADAEVLRRGLVLGKDIDPTQFRALGVAHVGAEPQSMHGGTFRMHDGFLTHSIYGDPVRPSLPAVPVGGSGLSELLSNLERARFALEFDGEGEHRGLHTQFEWTLRD